jgi:hypothetical protein
MYTEEINTEENITTIFISDNRDCKEERINIKNGYRITRKCKEH